MGRNNNQLRLLNHSKASRVRAPFFVKTKVSNHATRKEN